MYRKLTAAIPLICLLLPVGPTQAQDEAQRVYAFVGGRWFDGAEFVETTFYTSGGTLTAERPANVDSVIDLAGRYVVPPYGEAHNHNVEGSRAADVSRGYLAAGIFYVKNPNSLPGARERLAGVVNTPTSVDVVFAGGGITAPGGHPWGLVRRNIARGVFSQADGEGAFVHSVGDRSDLDQKWKMIEAQGPDFIKTYLQYSEEYSVRSSDSTYLNWTALDPELLTEIVHLAHAAGLRVSTHVETAADFHHAVRAGVDEINHLPGFRPEQPRLDAWDASIYQIAAEDAQQAARQGLVVVTTVGPLLEFLGGRGSEQFGAERAAQMRGVIERNLQLLKQHEVPIAIGTDRYQSTDATEAMNLLSLGIFSNLELLKMWAEVTPATIFPDRKLGLLQDGYEASFLVLAGNPLDDFSYTQRIALRVKQGVILTP